MSVRQTNLAKKEDVRSIPDMRFCIDGKMLYRFTGGQLHSSTDNMIAPMPNRYPMAKTGTN